MKTSSKTAPFRTTCLCLQEILDTCTLKRCAHLPSILGCDLRLLTVLDVGRTNQCEAGFRVQRNEGGLADEKNLVDVTLGFTHVLDVMFEHPHSDALKKSTPFKLSSARSASLLLLFFEKLRRREPHEHIRCLKERRKDAEKFR